MTHRILTFTPNPTVDIAADADEVRPIRKVRTRNETFDPGGGGVNVSRVVQALGGETLAIMLAGGLSGQLLDELLSEAEVPHRIVRAAGNTRMSHTVHDLSSGQEYRFVPEGPDISGQELQEALRLLEEVEGGWLVASGSLAPGMPEDLFVTLAAIARRRGWRYVVDTSGPPLRAALGPGVALIKPSRGEFEALVGGRPGSDAELDQAALAAVRDGKAGLVALTLGHEGALLAEPGGTVRLPALQVEAKGAVGAGDSFLAAMVLRLADGESPREAFAWGMAAGAAAVMRTGTAHPRREDVEALRQQIGPV